MPTQTRDVDPDFSLVLGGPLYQLYQRGRMSGPTLELVHRRMIVLAAITWVPLLVLTIADGVAWGGVAVPFLLHLGTHVRFLVSIPLLVAAELVVHQRIRAIVGQFRQRGLIAPEFDARFEESIEGAKRMRNSVSAEVFLLVVAFVVGHWFWTRHVALHVDTWYARPTRDGIHLTLPGYWYAFVGMPILRFITLRWYFRLIVWCRFLWQVSRIPLRLNPLHPDRAGGLGFLAASAYALVPVLLAHTVLLSAIIGDRIWHQGASLPQYRLEIAAVLIALLLAALLPQLFFMTQLGAARRMGVREYGALASRYVSEFRQKWITGAAPTDETLLGSGDIQSLADLGNSYEVVRDMGLVPFGRQAVIRLAIMIALPFAPLVLTMIPLDQIIDRVFGMFL